MPFHGQCHAANAAGGPCGPEASPHEEADGVAVRRHDVGLQAIKLDVSRKPDEGFQQELADASALIGINDT
jgi:hypothetical protein